MFSYLLRRLFLLPMTLLCIVLINFVIINLAPGEPTTITEISPQGEATRSEAAASVFGSDFRYLQFREHYGLTLPVILNTWPFLNLKDVEESIHTLVSDEDLSFKEKDQLRVLLGDQARYVMPKLIAIAENERIDSAERAMAIRFFIRGGTQQGFVGPKITSEERRKNQKIASSNTFLLDEMPLGAVNAESVVKLREWYQQHKEKLRFEPSGLEKWRILFFESRFFRYLSRVVTLDFGTLRDDPNKSVISEVAKRFKYSLTLAILPMCITFAFCMLVGFTMAIQQNRWPDYALNFLCLVLYALPIFVVAPFLVEKIALHGTFPWTDIPIPLSGFTSPERIYEGMTAKERLYDIFQHIFLPLVAIVYGSLAAQSRLARTAVLEVLRQEYVRTAWAKGLSPIRVWTKHVGRNAAITIVTAIASSLGVILGGSLIVETLFEINGFGKFFYDAVISRDYNVIMFSALAGSFLSLLGYLMADITYTALDPRVTLE